MNNVCSKVGRIGEVLLLCIGFAGPASVRATSDAELSARFARIQADPMRYRQALAAGRERATLCSVCHGEDGNSRKPDVPNLAGQNPHYLWKQIDNFASGRRRNFVMQALAKDFTDEDKINLAIYFASNMPRTGPADPQRAPRGAKLFRQRCAACHGPDGHGTRDYARLAGQRREYLVATLTAFRDGNGKRRSNVMSAQVRELSDDDIADLAAYLSALE